MAAMTLCGCMRVVMMVVIVGTQGANAQDWLEKWLKNRANGNIKLTDDLGFIGRTRRSVPSRLRMATRNDLLTSSEPEEPPMTSEKGRLLSTLTSRTTHRPTTLGITESSLPQTDSGPMTSKSDNDGLRERRSSADQRMAELQALMALAGNSSQVAHGQFDPEEIGKRKRSGDVTEDQRYNLLRGPMEKAAAENMPQ